MHLASAAEFRSHRAKRQLNSRFKCQTARSANVIGKEHFVDEEDYVKSVSSISHRLKQTFRQVSLTYRRSEDHFLFILLRFPLSLSSLPLVRSIFVGSFSRIHSADCNNRLQHEFHRRADAKKSAVIKS